MSVRDAAARCPITGISPFPFPRDEVLEPPALFDKLRTKSPVSRVRLWNNEEPWLVTGHSEARSLLGDPRVSASRHAGHFPFTTPSREAAERMERSFIVLDPPEHGPRRQVFTRFFTVRAVKAFRPAVVAIVDSLIDDMLAMGPPVDLVATLAQEIPARTICHVLGLPPEDRAFFQSRDTERNTLGSTPAAVQQATQEMLSYIDGVISDRIAHPGDDLVSQVVASHLRTGLVPRDTLRSMLRHLLAAGHDTTAQMIALGSLTLLRHPEQTARLRNEPELMPGAVEELLRYVPLFQMSPNRVAAADIDIAGVRIRRGDGIIIPAAAANRDPAVFADPGKFDVARDSAGHIAFAFGVHQCLGQNLARLELQVVFAAVLRRLPTLAEAEPEAGLTVSDYLLLRLDSLPVTWSIGGAQQAQTRTAVAHSQRPDGSRVTASLAGVSGGTGSHD